MLRTRTVIALGAPFIVVALLSACGGDDSANPVVFSDAAPVDGPTDTTLGDAVADGSAICQPRDLGGFTPTWTPPGGFHQKKCSTAQLATIAACLQPNSDAAACAAFYGASENADCMKCASAENNAFAGCVAVATGDLSATGCGAKYLALLECSNFACAGCPLRSPFEDAGSSASAGFCAQAAQNGVCKSYADAARCTAGLLSDGSAAAVCNHPGQLAYFVELFCGDVPSDGGLDAPSDG